MYVTGRGTPGYGTVLPALFEGRRRGLIGEILLSATTPASLDEARARAETLGRLMGVDGTVRCVVAPVDPAAARGASGSMPAAIVSVPDAVHADVAVPLLERGIPCLVVKPFAPTLAAARRMCQAAERGRAYGAVEFHKRWDAANVRLRDEIRAGRLGVPLYAVIEFSQKKQVPLLHFRGWAHQTNVFQYLGVHYVDLLWFATGYRPEAVSACGQRAYLQEQGIDTEDAVQVMIRWKTPHGVPFVSTHLTNWIDPDGSSAMSDQRLTVVGTLGRYRSDQKDRGVQMVTDASGVEDVNPYFTSLSYDPALGALRCLGYGPDSILTFVEDVADLRAGRRAPADLEGLRPTFASALVSTAAIEAAGESLKRDGAWVPVAAW
jgi:predicted dehydrogenase